MTSKRKTRILHTLRELIAHLRSLDGADQPMGLKAGANLESTLLALESDFDGAVPLLACDIGGKGILDWVFSESEQRTVGEYCERLHKLVHTRWWEFWK
jgi:hypothetical protein